jgi:hypothetical protein
MVTAALCAAATSAPAPAGADELPPDPRGTTALLVGAGVAGVSFGTGMTMTGTSGDGFVQNAGIVIAETGLVLAPIAAHAVAGEWKRGFIFAIAPLATEIGMLVLIDQWGEKLVTLAPLGTQYLYSALFTGSVLFSAIGIVDAALASGRAASDAPRAPPAPAPAPAHAWVAPMFDRYGGGIKVGGFL